MAAPPSNRKEWVGLVVGALLVLPMGYSPVGLDVDALYVYGGVSEGWFPNPPGLVILGIGIWLVAGGIRQRKGSG